MKFFGPIRVDLLRSRLLAAVLAGMHLATLLPLWLAGLPEWAAAVLALAILTHGGWAIRRYALLRSPHSLIAVTLQPAGDCILTLRNGTDIAGPVDPATVVLGSLVILAIRRGAIRPGIRALIAGGMAPDEDLRRLRVGLKWGGAQDSRAGHA